MAGEHVFLSYIREDKDQVDELQDALEAAGFTVWRDTKDLWPGENWELKILQAIREGSFVFLACFSSALADREQSYQFSELTVAAEEYRRRPVDSSWLMTVRFDECEVPPFDLGAGRSLDRTIHRVDLFGGQKMAQMARLTTAISRAMGANPGVPSPVVLQAVADSKRAEGSRVDRLRDLIRNPALVMDYDETLLELREEVLGGLRDRERFPMSGSGGSTMADDARAWVDRINAYDALIADVLEPVRLLGMYGQVGHEDGLTQFMRAVGAECTQLTGLNLYRHAHEYPALALSYVGGLAALVKSNFGSFRAMTADVTVRLPSASVPFVAYSGGRSVPGDWTFLGTLLVRAAEGNELTDEMITNHFQGKVSNLYTPISDHLFTMLSPLFATQFASDEDYADSFDRVEVLFDAITEDTRSRVKFYGGRNGYGRYTWRHKHVDAPIEQVMLEELETAGSGWTPLLGGLFGGDVERAKSAMGTVVETARLFRGQQW